MPFQVFYDTRLSDCLDILLNKGVSGLPVVDPKTLEVQDVYTRFELFDTVKSSRNRHMILRLKFPHFHQIEIFRFDAVGIALSQANCLDVTVEEALAYKRNIDVRLFRNNLVH